MISDETLRELEGKREVLRGLLHDNGELRGRLSDERAGLAEAQLLGDRSLVNIKRLGFLSGQQVTAQRQHILIGNQLAEVQEQINRIGVSR